jgi:hypothetical protein
MVRITNNIYTYTLRHYHLIISEAFKIQEKLDPDDDALVTLTDLRKFLEENNVNNSLVEAKYLIGEAIGRGESFLVKSKEKNVMILQNPQKLFIMGRFLKKHCANYFQNSIFLCGRYQKIKESIFVNI